MRDRIGVENIMWSSDFPHPVSRAGRTRAKIVAESLGGLSPADRELVVSANTRRAWNLP